MIFVDKNLLVSIKRLTSQLSELIEPDFGLLNQLVSFQVLTRREVADVRSEKTVFRRCDALLDLLSSDVQCRKFVIALQRTNQQHIVNFIVCNGGQKTIVSNIHK